MRLCENRQGTHRTDSHDGPGPVCPARARRGAARPPTAASLMRTAAGDDAASPGRRRGDRAHRRRTARAHRRPHDPAQRHPRQARHHRHRRPDGADPEGPDRVVLPGAAGPAPADRRRAARGRDAGLRRRRQHPPGRRPGRGDGRHRASARARCPGSAPSSTRDVAAWRTRPLDEHAFPYVFLDATYCKARINQPGRVPGRRHRHRRLRRRPPGGAGLRRRGQRDPGVLDGVPARRCATAAWAGCSWSSATATAA